MNWNITFILYFTFCPFAMALFFPPFFNFDLHHHKHHQSHSHQSHHSASSTINIGSSNSKTHNTVQHVYTQQTSKSKESKFFLVWVYKYSVRVSSGRGKYHSSGSIGIGGGYGQGHSQGCGGCNQINSGSSHNSVNQQTSSGGHNEKPTHENQNNPWTIDDNSYVTDQSIHRPITHAIPTTKTTVPFKIPTTTLKPFKPTKATTTTPEPTEATTTTPVPSTITTTSEPITDAPNNPPIIITTEESIIVEKSTTLKPAESGSNESEQSSHESNSHSGSFSGNPHDIPGVNKTIESIISQIQAQKLPCPPEQLVIIKTGSVNVENHTDASTGSTSIVVKPIIVVAPISVASTCGLNC